jgi:hypothetical protein
MAPLDIKECTRLARVSTSFLQFSRTTDDEFGVFKRLGISQCLVSHLPDEDARRLRSIDDWLVAWLLLADGGTYCRWDTWRNSGWDALRELTKVIGGLVGYSTEFVVPAQRRHPRLRLQSSQLDSSEYRRMAGLGAAGRAAAWIEFLDSHQMSTHR